jgi:predicted membrane-bound spermidine synthase
VVSAENPVVGIAAPREDGDIRPAAVHYPLVLLFLVSGLAALVYQVCWQRLLFESVGTDIDSVTIIVSTFMLGLGVGALAGGEIVDRYPHRTLELFAIAELATGMFGVCSPWLIKAVTAATANASLPTIAVANFALLLPPTILMGATLPILVNHVVRTYKNLGVSVATLYGANTLGAALGSALTGLFVLYYFGLRSTIYMAAALNVSVGVSVWFGLRRKRV